MLMHELVEFQAEMGFWSETTSRFYAFSTVLIHTKRKNTIRSFLIIFSQTLIQMKKSNKLIINHSLLININTIKKMKILKYKTM